MQAVFVIDTKWQIPYTSAAKKRVPINPALSGSHLLSSEDLPQTNKKRVE
jgi:hypothetical protein